MYLLNTHPALASRRIGDMQMTPLHVAVDRNDLVLAQVLLSAHADLSIKDAVFAGTPLDWAKHFQHTEMIELIGQHQTKQSPT